MELKTYYAYNKVTWDRVKIEASTLDEAKRKFKASGGDLKTHNVVPPVKKDKVYNEMSFAQFERNEFKNRL